MQVAYDISMLGMGYVNNKARTGIYRVAESLLFQLVKQPEIELKAIAFNNKGSIWDDISAQLYLQRLYPDLEAYFSSYYHSKLHLRNLYDSAVQLQRALIKLSGNNNILIYKLAQAIQLAFTKFASIDVKWELPNQEWDIYHSPYFTLPNCDILGNIPRLLTVHDLIPGLFPQFSTPKVYRQFVATINSIDYEHDWITCVSQYTKQDFCNYTGMNPERVFVTPLAAADFFHPVTESEVITRSLKPYGITDSPYLLSLCTLEPRKNLSFLIRCFSRIITENPSLDINLVLVGVNGWKNKDIFATANHNPEVKSRIIFTGYVPDTDLSAIYSGAIAFVYPSLYEGFGLPPLEAMQCGTPVITSKTSSLPEVVGEAGILIDPKQEDELCQALLKVINDSQLRAEMSQRSLQQASQFSWSKCAEDTVKVYQIAANN